MIEVVPESPVLSATLNLRLQRVRELLRPCVQFSNNVFRQLIDELAVFFQLCQGILVQIVQHHYQSFRFTIQLALGIEAVIPNPVNPVVGEEEVFPAIFLRPENAQEVMIDDIAAQREGVIDHAPAVEMLRAHLLHSFARKVGILRHCRQIVGNQFREQERICVAIDVIPLQRKLHLLQACLRGAIKG